MFTRQFLLDTLERAVATFAQALLGTGTVLDFSDGRVYAAAGIAAAICVLKCLAATQVGASDSGSLLPASEDPPVEGDAGHAELHGVLAMALAILLGLIVWSILGAHTDLY
jgi:hypothetical protein